MKKLVILFIALFVMPFSFLAAQQIDLKAEYDQKTYDQYLAKDWSGLISSGKEAIEKNVDFYYLRLRMGIAYGAQFNYRMAIVNYKKALEFAPNDPLAQEYLYYAYYYAGMKHTAALYAASLPVSLRNKIDPQKLSAFGNIFMEGGAAFSTYDDGETSLSSATNQYFTETMLPQWQSYFNGSLLFNLSNSLSWSLAYTGLNIHSNHLYKINSDPTVEEEVLIKQKDLYTSLNIYSKDGLIVIPFFHNINTAMNYTAVDYDTTAYTLAEGIAIAFDETVISTQWNDPLVGIGFYKRNKMVDFAMSVSYSWLGYDEQQQLSALLNFLPKGNYSLYFTPSVRLLRNSEKINVVSKMLIGWSPSLKLWTETSFTYGDLRGTHEIFGYTVYNIPDATRYKADAAVYLALANGVSLSLRYQFTRKESAIFSNSIVTQTTGGGYGMGGASTEIVWKQTAELHLFTQQFFILGFNWAI